MRKEERLSNAGSQTLTTDCLGFLDRMIYCHYLFTDQTLSIQTYIRLALTEATGRFGKYGYICNLLPISEPSSRCDQLLAGLPRKKPLPSSGLGPLAIS